MVGRQVEPVGRLPRAVLERVRDDADDLARGVAVVGGQDFEAVGHVADDVAGLADAPFDAFGTGCFWGRSVGHFLFFSFLCPWDLVLD